MSDRTYGQWFESRAYPTEVDILLICLCTLENITYTSNNLFVIYEHLFSDLFYKKQSNQKYIALPLRETLPQATKKNTSNSAILPLMLICPVKKQTLSLCLLILHKHFFAVLTKMLLQLTFIFIYSSKKEETFVSWPVYLQTNIPPIFCQTSYFTF